jgi:hypothetical protein
MALLADVGLPALLSPLRMTRKKDAQDTAFTGAPMQAAPPFAHTPR